MAYLVLTHKDVEQVEALGERILDLSPTAHVVVHHDREAEGVPWGGSPPARAHLVSPVAVAWGDWSIVEATLRLLRYAADLGADWFVVLSGEHWPVVDLAHWEGTLDTRGVDAFLPDTLLPHRLRFGSADLDGNRFLARCIHRWFRIRRPRISVVHRALAALSKVSLLTHPVLKLEFSLRSDAWFVGVPRPRGPLKGWDLYKGSQWIAFNARAARVLLDADRAVATWFSHSHIPDESYFQTLLHRAGVRIDDSPVTWVPPEPELATAGWMLLKPADLDRVVSSGVAFARKVDRHRNPEVIELLDARVDRARSSEGIGG